MSLPSDRNETVLSRELLFHRCKRAHRCERGTRHVDYEEHREQRRRERSKNSVVDEGSGRFDRKVFRDGIRLSRRNRTLHNQSGSKATINRDYGADKSLVVTPTS